MEGEFSRVPRFLGDQREEKKKKVCEEVTLLIVLLHRGRRLG
jgi:hypothetical protein